MSEVSRFALGWIPLSGFSEASFLYCTLRVVIVALTSPSKDFSGQIVGSFGPLAIPISAFKLVENPQRSGADPPAC